MATKLARPPRAFVYEDLGGMPDDGYRREIIDGDLVVSPAPASGHQRMGGMLSASSRAQDRLVKRELYERLGVPAYWIVDPKVLSIEALRLVGSGYEAEAEVSGEGVFATDWPFPVSVVPARLMG
ncbi:MAG: Uma2 family endonuclease [Acidimicrobiales bacterium]